MSEILRTRREVLVAGAALGVAGTAAVMGPGRAIAEALAGDPKDEAKVAEVRAAAQYFGVSEWTKNPNNWVANFTGTTGKGYAYGSDIVEGFKPHPQNAEPMKFFPFPDVRTIGGYVDVRYNNAINPVVLVVNPDIANQVALDVDGHPMTCAQEVVYFRAASLDRSVCGDGPTNIPALRARFAGGMGEVAKNAISNVLPVGFELEGKDANKTVNGIASTTPTEVAARYGADDYSRDPNNWTVSREGSGYAYLLKERPGGQHSLVAGLDDAMANGNMALPFHSNEHAPFFTGKELAVLLIAGNLPGGMKVPFRGVTIRPVMGEKYQVALDRLMGQSCMVEKIEQPGTTILPVGFQPGKKV